GLPGSHIRCCGSPRWRTEPNRRLRTAGEYTHPAGRRSAALASRLAQATAAPGKQANRHAAVTKEAACIYTERSVTAGNIMPGAYCPRTGLPRMAEATLVKSSASPLHQN